MARQAVFADGSAGQVTTHTATATIAGVDRYTLIGLAWRVNTNVQDTITYGTGNTIYDLGVDETAKIGSFVFPAPRTDHSLAMFEAFNVDHPANGSVTITVTFTAAVRCAVLAVQYDAGDQVDGYRGVAVDLSTDLAAWDLTGITNNAADQETVGFAGHQDGTATHTADADNPELAEVSSGGGLADIGVIISDTTSRATLGGDFSNARPSAMWGASILTAAAGANLSVNLAGRGGLVGAGGLAGQGGGLVA